MGYWIYGIMALAAFLTVIALAMTVRGAPMEQIIAVVVTLWLMGLTSLMAALALLIFSKSWVCRLFARLKALVPIDR